MRQLETGRISSFQYMCILLIIRMTDTTITFPFMTGHESPTDAWIGAVIGTVASLIILELIVRFSLNFPGMTAVQFSQAILGKFFGSIVAFLIIGFWIFDAAVTARAMGGAVVTAFMPETPILVFIAMTVFLSANGARHGIEITGRWSEMVARYNLVRNHCLAVPNDGLQNLCPYCPTGLAPPQARCHNNCCIPQAQCVGNDNTVYPQQKGDLALHEVCGSGERNHADSPICRPCGGLRIPGYTLFSAKSSACKADKHRRVFRKNRDHPRNYLVSERWCKYCDVYLGFVSGACSVVQSQLVSTAGLSGWSPDRALEYVAFQKPRGASRVFYTYPARVRSLAGVRCVCFALCLSYTQQTRTQETKDTGRSHGLGGRTR